MLHAAEGRSGTSGRILHLDDPEVSGLFIGLKQGGVFAPVLQQCNNTSVVMFHLIGSHQSCIIMCLKERP